MVRLLAVLACAGIAAVIDLRTRRIPNSLTASAALLGLGLAAAGWTDVSLGSAVLGLVLGTALMLPGYRFGGTGAGDVKMLGAMGTMLGGPAVILAFLYTAIAGGVIAILVAAHRRRLSETLRGVLRVPGEIGTARAAAAPARLFAYGPAIAIGCIAAALLGG